MQRSTKILLAVFAIAMVGWGLGTLMFDTPASDPDPNQVWFGMKTQSRITYCQAWWDDGLELRARFLGIWSADFVDKFMLVVARECR